MKIEDIKTVYVHWSESELISKSLGYNEDSDINKEVDKFEFDAFTYFRAGCLSCKKQTHGYQSSAFARYDWNNNHYFVVKTIQK